MHTYFCISISISIYLSKYIYIYIMHVICVYIYALLCICSHAFTQYINRHINDMGSSLKMVKRRTD